MEDYNGLLALFAACLNLVLLLNLLVFAEKNKINKFIILLVSLMALDQFLEFINCYFESADSMILLLKLVVLYFIPAVILLIALNIRMLPTNYTWLVMIFPIMFSVISAASGSEIVLLSCSPGSASYVFPLGVIIDTYFVLYFTLGAGLLYSAFMKFENQKNRIIAIFAGLVLAVLPAVIAGLVSNSAYEIKESLAGKTLLTLSITLTYYSLKNKSVKL